MAGTVAYRGDTIDHDHSHAYITDRRCLVSQTRSSEWGPIRGKFTRNELTAVTPTGASIAGTDAAATTDLSDLWADDVLQSTNVGAETCPFPFISYILPATRSRVWQQPQNQEVQRPPKTIFSHYDAESLIAADQTIISETLIENGFMSTTARTFGNSPFPRPVETEDALSTKLPNGTYEKWKPEENRYPTIIVEEVWRKSLTKIRAKVEKVNQRRTDCKLAPVRDADANHATVVAVSYTHLTLPTICSV